MMLQKIVPLLLITFLTACEGCKDDPAPKTELEKLPPATQEGKNTFGCLVNGKAWVTETSIDATAAYQMGIFQVGASFNHEGMSFAILSSTLSPNSEYDLTNDPVYQAGFSSIEKNGCIYDIDKTLEGKLILIKLDQSNLIVSGFFEFTTVTENCDTIKVTDGRFDLTYAN